MKSGVVTLGIGDGWNDILMLREVSVGVAIVKGGEGDGASMTADIVVDNFGELNRILFYHGRLSYKRTSLFIKHYFYKNMLIVVIDFVF